MSSSLMSCVRENSPPLELDINESGALSLPESSTMITATGGAVSSSSSSAPMSPGALSANSETAAATSEQQKRRRFHPLRNLRRIFRRRTITSVNDSPAAAAVRATNIEFNGSIPPPTCATSEKNLRSATLSSISSVVSASSPSSPLALQLLHANSYSLPKSKAAGSAQSQHNVLLATKLPQHQQQLQAQTLHGDFDTMNMHGTGAMSTEITPTAYVQRHQYTYNMSAHPATINNTNILAANTELHPLSTTAGHRSSTMGGVAVLPGAFNAALSRSFFAERQKLKSLGDSSQELDSSANSSLGSGSRRAIAGNERNTGHHATTNGSGGEMTDSQRSFSEGRLVDSDYSRDGLSQSHDSVFSESATASSLSIVLKAELADALRKRRNRPDASDEDLGLPRSPASPQRRSEHSVTANATTPTATGNQSEVSSLSMLSINSNEGDSIFTETAANAILHERSYLAVTSSRYSHNSTLSALSLSSDKLRPNSAAANEDKVNEIDLFSSNWQRLSHSAAKHKMAVRQTKKKGPSRHHRRTLETTIPEANEDLFKIGGTTLLNLMEKDAKTKTRSFPPGANARLLEHQIENIITAAATSSNTTKTTESSTNLSPIERTKTEKWTPLEPYNAGSTSSKPNAASSSNSFGLRNLTAKASSIFESKCERNGEDETPTPVLQSESSESGFLRRFITRNSKRTIAKAKIGDDKLDNLTEPKKLQISTSAFDTRETMPTPRLGKSQSAIAYEQQVEQTRKDIKREILSEGNTGLSAMLNSYTCSGTKDIKSMPSESKRETLHGNMSAKEPATSVPKPKSGPAARQRYLPKDILSSTLEKSRATKSPVKECFSSTSLITKSLNEESFQSTSIIREITASQSLTASKSEHHFEKKPKIIGLSAFQQKVSRSNDSSVTRASTNVSSSNSLDVNSETVFINYDQKQRKSVEKSRSFRTYNENKDQGVHNNMPSLPDLTLQLPSFGEFILNDKEYSSPSPPDKNDQSMSLGFEINDNNLVRPASRAESSGSLGATSAYRKTPTKASTPSKLYAPTTSVLRSLSPTNSCSNDMSEIEQNIDMIVKSPFVSVLRKSATVNEELAVKHANDISDSRARNLESSFGIKGNENMHSNCSITSKGIKTNETKLNTSTSSASNAYTFEKCSALPKSSPAVASIPKCEQSNTCIAESSAAPMTTAKKCNGFLDVTVIVKREIGKHTSPAVPPAKIDERKSLGACNPSTKDGACNTHSFNRPRRSCSVTECSQAVGSCKTAVPEFLKIQLNRVDPCTRAPKSTVVLAKNVKEPATKETTSEKRSASTDDLSLRRFSNESVDISEHEIPVAEKPFTCLFEAINKQTKSVSTSSIRCTSREHSPPKSQVKQTPTLSNSTPETPVINIPTSMLINKVEAHQVATKIEPLPEEHVVLRHKPPKHVEPLSSSHKLSLQERKRLFLSEEKLKAEKKVEEMKNERKKSICEEMQRKSCNMKTEIRESTAAEPFEKDATVIMRKKSFGTLQQAANGNASGGNSNSGSNNSNNSGTNNSGSNGNNGNGSNKDDATPELMKVFARRSLKIKDEDLAQLNTQIFPSQAAALRKSAANVNQPKQSNVDSDKENQSASDEKLDQLHKVEAGGIIEPSPHIKTVNSNSPSTISMGTTSSNRSSTSEFRKNSSNSSGTALGSNSQNSNSNTNSNKNIKREHANNNNNVTSSKTLHGSKSSLPVLRGSGGFRSISNLESENNGEKKYHTIACTDTSNNNINNNGSSLTQTTAQNSFSSNSFSINSNSKSTLERQSLVIRGVTTAESAVGIGKTIERSATVGEFKGIHQRRAEWEQRAKEALK